MPLCILFPLYFVYTLFSIVNSHYNYPLDSFHLVTSLSISFTRIENSRRFNHVQAFISFYTSVQGGIKTLQVFHNHSCNYRLGKTLLHIRN